MGFRNSKQVNAKSIPPGRVNRPREDSTTTQTGCLTHLVHSGRVLKKYFNSKGIYCILFFIVISKIFDTPPSHTNMHSFLFSSSHKNMHFLILECHFSLKRWDSFSTNNTLIIFLSISLFLYQFYIKNRVET